MLLTTRSIRVAASLAAVACFAALAACANEEREPSDDAGTDAPVVDASGDTSTDAPSTDAVSDTGTDAPGPTWTACAVPSDCTLAANTCCGVCGQPTIDDVDGIHVADWDAHYATVCDDPDPLCPGCASMPNPWLLAECADAACTATDVRTDPVTACTTDDECVLRTPECCTCGSDFIPEQLIALRADAEGEWRSRVCDPDTDCATCEPEYPGYVRAACSDEGRCVIEYLED